MIKYLQILIFTLITQFGIAQTLEIFNINPELDAGSGPYHFLAHNKLLFFNAYHPDFGSEPWVTNGTQEGTHLLKDINLENSSNPAHFFSYNEYVFFSADLDGDYRGELWRTDGTTEGTVMVIDAELPGASTSDEYFIYNDLLYVSGSSYLIATDGTTEGSHPIAECGASDFCILGDKLFFSGYDQVHETELWTSDGTEEGTHLFYDFYEGGVGLPLDLFVWNDHMYFHAQDAINRRQLWKSDGTVEGTQIFKGDLTQSTPQSFPTQFIEYKNELYFRAGTEEYSSELWKTDGTIEGTKMVKNIHEEHMAEPSDLIVFNEKLFFTANDGITGYELWQTDGTEEGTNLVIDLDPGYNSAYPTNKIVYNNKLYFRANDSRGHCIWETDGTVAGTKRIIPDNALESGLNVNSFYAIAEMNGSLYFSAKYTNDGSELWKYTTITGVEEKKKDLSLDISPNPANNFINLNSVNKMEGIQIFDLLGNQINSYKPANKINIANLNSGSYILQVKTNKGYVRKKFIKID
jgi:ELWxxDGT repeat protein